MIGAVKDEDRGWLRFVELKANGRVRLVLVRAEEESRSRGKA